ncbi:hypothetical protein KSC_055650 [Ktedonobacter sp. SOSP1-52]|uniref:SRPBCC family protein n=1 Tax=Ktedonobacter sp. SOSP1-52 TaxID=2778366 RepID=UPI0019157ECB|nr:SRPBCC family protein [Ktedonobacter sp. SOSP1-52]GHO66673.1 hypothetical protein KSC_055650 [Ktedonobacter sp. SOSP1-52]
MRVVKTVLINRPVEEVFAYVTDMCKVTEWTPAREIRPVNDVPMGVGARFLQAGEFLNQRMEFTTEVTHYEVPRLFGFKSLTGPVNLETTIIFEPIENGTRVTMMGEGEPGGMLKFARGLVSTMLDKQINAQLHKLKKNLEKA